MPTTSEQDALQARNLVSANWLISHLRAPDVVIVDATWHLPTTGRNAQEDYLAGHIPGALFFDIDAIADTASGLPHMLPSPEAFSSRMRRMGIGDGQTIVVYDSYGLFSAPRVWWTFKVMGVRDVVILDGGLPAWIAAGGELEEGPIRRPERHFTARLNNSAVRDIAAVRAVLQNGAAQVVDARSAGRFKGDEPEPRAGVRSGHMPGALNVPVGEVVENGKLKQPDAVRAVFEARGVDLERPIVTSCGSGVTAAVLTFALASIGVHGVSLYDGSWTEWGGRDDTPVVTGA
jgi:thiosulfate/3-mercaptopyruvate sulfurtransferase